MISSLSLSTSSWVHYDSSSILFIVDLLLSYFSSPSVCFFFFSTSKLTIISILFSHPVKKIIFCFSFSFSLFHFLFLTSLFKYIQCFERIFGIKYVIVVYMILKAVESVCSFAVTNNKFPYVSYFSVSS